MAVLMIAVAGCAHSDKAERVDSVRRAFTTEPPPFLNGPCALLLTNSGGYASHVVMERGATGEKANILSGELLGRGAKLFFAVESNGSKSKRSVAGSVSFVWDATTNGGFILSDALQGYAPVSSNLRFTNVTVSTAPSRAPRENSAGTIQELTVAGTDGSLTTFRVWHSGSSTDLPSRIDAISGTSQFSLHLTKIQAVPPAPRLFEPPPGFTRYDTAENMMYEIVARQQNVRRRSYEPSAAELEGQPMRPGRY